MSFKDWLKKLFSEEKQENRATTLSELPKLIEQETEKLKAVEEQLKQEIKLETEDSISKLRLQVQAAEAVNLSKRKEEERIKVIVRGKFESLSLLPRKVYQGNTKYR